MPTTMKTTFLTIVIFVSASLSNCVLAQVEYQHGHGALQIFDQKGFAAAPKWVQIWIGFMFLSFAAGLFFVRQQPIARWIVGSFTFGMAAMAVAGTLFSIAPVSGFIATLHLVFWSPALYQLLRRRPFLRARSAFSIWTAVITGVILFSFTFDLRDSAIYLQHVFN